MTVYGPFQTGKARNFIYTDNFIEEDEYENF